MPYYTFKIISSGKNVLTKQFSTQDCIDLHFLLANEDYVGVDLFCQLKFEEYANDKTKLNSLDKFLFLVSQKIISHTFDTSVVHSIQGNESKITKIVSLVNIYNPISDTIFKQRDLFSEGALQIEYGIPFLKYHSLLCKKKFILFITFTLSLKKILLNCRVLENMFSSQISYLLSSYFALFKV